MGICQLLLLRLDWNFDVRLNTSRKLPHFAFVLGLVNTNGEGCSWVVVRLTREENFQATFFTSPEERRQPLAVTVVGLRDYDVFVTTRVVYATVVALERQRFYKPIKPFWSAVLRMA